MELKEALIILGIEEFSDRIINSNSQGELFHLVQYFVIAEALGETDWFANWFKEIVTFAEAEWERPESVFQHIHKLLIENFKNQISHPTPQAKT
ncbi:hypothetical protein [Lacinutrix sp. Hel_I_90]|uniref:hypothetical protein n=1 Tax=Lacinutrix sp. Hel_I_90 TaxID=1249999 RepID=UPI0005CAC81D|nr:hypothetical protein [Lacinutrix sp. Hel_I_90]